MAEKRRFLDVWIVESNTVYQEVPFMVVADWVQQGRLLEDDKLRPSGTKEWFPVGSSPEFAPYLPRPEPFRAEDQAEALEPVQLDFAWKRRHEDEDDDVDMIPLIDVSLVLLIFFMMTTAGISAALIAAPPAENGETANDTSVVRIDINLVDGDPVYAVGTGNNPPASADDRDLHSVQELLPRLREHLERLRGQVDVGINAHQNLEAGVVRDLMVRLESDPYFRRKIDKKYNWVTGK
jgi:biopolymer transport protein ExbD